MKQSTILFGSVALAAVLMATDGFAIGGRGGGGGVAGGARPAASPAFNRSPSMSRVASPTQRPAANLPASPTQRPAANVPATPAQRPAANLPAASGLGQRPATGAVRPGTGGPATAGPATLPSPQSYQRPSQNQVSNFLNLPQQPSGRSPSPPVPTQLPAGGQGVASKTVTTPGGSTITIAGGKGSGTTAGGATVGGAGAGIKVEGPGGNTYVKGTGVAGATKNGHTAVAGGSLTAARNQWGYTAVNVRGGYSAGGTGRAGSITGIRGPGGTAIAAGRGAAFVNGQFVGGRTWTAVNGAYRSWNYFTPGWIGRYPALGGRADGRSPPRPGRR